MSDRDDDRTGDVEGGSEPSASGSGTEPDAPGGSAGDGGEARRTGATGPPTGGEDRSLRTYLLWGGLLVLGVLAVVATAGLYSSLSSVIDVWIGDRFRPIARAVLNFGVLCVAAAGIAVLLRRV